MPSKFLLFFDFWVLIYFIYYYIINTMLDTVRLFGYAKVNLALGVKGAVEGFHDLDTVMVSVDIADEIAMVKRSDNQITVSYTNGELFENDNALKVAKALSQRYGTGGVGITISKGVPIGVGLGGSAVDGAGIIRGYERLYDLKVDDEDFMVKLGGDIPFLKKGGSAIVKGRGEIVIPVELPPIHILLVYGAPSISTAKVFALYDNIGGDGGKSSDFITDLMPFNALEKSAVQLEPTIINSRKLLEEAGFTRVVMTGSGSGYIGYELDEKEFIVKAERAKILSQAYGLKVRILKTIKDLQ